MNVDDRCRRVALVLPVFPQLSETFIVAKAVGLVGRGWDIQIVCASSPEANWDAFGNDHPVHSLRDRVHTTLGVPSARTAMALLGRTGVLAVRQPAGFRDYVSTSQQLHRPIVRGVYVDETLIRLHPDIVHFEFGPAAIGRMHLRKALGCAVSVSFRGSDLNVVGLDDESYYDDIWEHADGIHVLGKSLVRQAHRRGAPDSAPISIISPALAAKPIVAGEDRLDDVTESRPLRILSVGRLHWTKGYLDAVDAVADLRDRGVPVEHRIVGGGDLAEAISFWRHERRLDDVVELIGPASPSEVAAHYMWADVFLHAAVTEGFCNAALEAQAHGLPVVCTDAGGLLENVLHGETGIVAARRDPRALADGLEKLAADRPLLRRLGAAGRARAAQSFGIEGHLDAWEQFNGNASERRSVGDRQVSGPSAARMAVAEPSPRMLARGSFAAPPATNPEPLRVWAGDLDGIDIHNRSVRLSLNPIVRAHLDHRLNDDDRAERYGSLLTHYRLTEAREAEIAVLPCSFDVTDAVDLRRRVNGAEAHGLRTIVTAAHDLEPLLPSASMVLLHPGPTRGAQPFAAALAIPYFFTDRSIGRPTRQGEDRPSVAFCGQAAVNWPASMVQTSQRAVEWAINRYRPLRVTPPIRGHVSLRSRAIDSLRQDDRVDDRFIIRDRYRAGANSEAERSRTQAEFDDNLRSSTYALCVRGTGNFSARFYEALSFGRVPLFVDTSCVLPFEDEIDWRERCVWVEESEVGEIADRLVAEHDRDDPAGLRSETGLRALWEDRLTQSGFFRHLVPVLRNLA